MPWGDGPGRLPPLRAVDGPTLLRLVMQTQVHEVTTADEAGEGEAREPWHDFADLMRDLGDSAADLAEADRVLLAAELDLLIAELRRKRPERPARSARRALG